MPAEFRDWIEVRLARGDAIALHGLTHRDEAPPPGNASGRLRRSVYTAEEGEFSALTREDAAHRIEEGRRWLTEQGWSTDGFVAPAWLMSDGAWKAVRSAGFLYTTTLTRFHLLKHDTSLCAPTLVYSTRTAWRRALSRAWNAALATGTQGARLVRFGFHPADAQHETLMRHAAGILAQVAENRRAVTKSEFARTLA